METLALVRLVLGGLRPLPRRWSALDPEPRGRPLVVLFPERGLPAASLARLGRRLAADLGTPIHVEPRAHAWAAVATRLDRARDRVAALRAMHPRRPLVLVGHGEGGKVACLLATDIAAPHLHVVALATAQRAADAPARRTATDGATTCLYSVHDALVTPPERAYVPGALNVALRDVGHFGMVLEERPYALLREIVAEVATDAPRVGGTAS